jgi:hypothetical protein
VPYPLGTEEPRRVADMAGEVEHEQGADDDADRVERER